MNIRGIDTMAFGLDIKDYPRKFRPILDELKEKKDLGHDEGKEQQIHYGNLLLDVGLTGIRFYAYKLRCKDFVLAFTEKPTETNSEVFVGLSSGYLWSYGYQEAYEKFRAWFNIFPGKVEKTRLSRLDICLDTDEINFTPEDKERFITRAKNIVIRGVDDEFHSGKTFSGFTIGRGNPIMARIYNKTLEIKNSNKEWFKNIWKDNGWDGQKVVWRIEFQLRRNALKELGINSVEEIQENLDALWKYLITEWLYLDHEKWRNVKKTTNPVIEPLVRKTVIQGDIQRLSNQAIGLVTSIGAYGNLPTIEESLNYVRANAEKKWKNKNTTYLSETKNKRDKYLKETEVKVSGS